MKALEAQKTKKM